LKFIIPKEEKPSYKSMQKFARLSFCEIGGQKNLLMNEAAASSTTTKTRIDIIFPVILIKRRRSKIMGQIGENDQRDKLIYNSLVRQIKTGISQGFKESEIVDAVIRSIVPGLVLRSYFESFQDLPRAFEANFKKPLWR